MHETTPPISAEITPPTATLLDQMAMAALDKLAQRGHGASIDPTGATIQPPTSGSFTEGLDPATIAEAQANAATPIDDDIPGPTAPRTTGPHMASNVHITKHYDLLVQDTIGQAVCWIEHGGQFMVDHRATRSQLINALEQLALASVENTARLSPLRPSPSPGDLVVIDTIPTKDLQGPNVW